MSAYICPLCQKTLHKQNHSLHCEDGHQFDYAKEGYINLLPVQYKKSKQPGDNQEMVQARRRFLGTQSYRFMRDALAQKVASLHHANTAVVDMGCGEGYYTSELSNQLNDAGTVYGIDIAKPAIRYAAKRYPDCQFAVASSKQIPLAPASASVVTSVFAPIFAQESARLLHDEGFLVVVSPGPKHLLQLKEIIYQDVREHEKVETPEGFERVADELLEQQLVLSGSDAKDLSLMTPFAWKFSEKQLIDLEQQAAFEVQAQFYISVFQKNS
ncbi:23S rRNA (guanine(745)-N(1))-methyltransferase [Pseudoalteromonas sp. SSDWG2]|uniref:23S rRNA (guanine(745)-N(1))-methyltransferase n=1 Tax=Pseudoalteromonas sp. SSDWG2 TaxID=3139391 RepID=UPI003BACDBF8